MTRSVGLSSSSVAPGSVVEIHLTGWPVGAANAVVCGNGGARGSQDCDVVHGVGLRVEADGTARSALRVTPPPVPCPCVIEVRDATNATKVLTPINIVGAPIAPIVRNPEIGAFAAAKTPPASRDDLSALPLVAVGLVVALVAVRAFKQRLPGVRTPLPRRSDRSPKMPGHASDRGTSVNPRG